jgi:hypothetical protein
MAQNLTVPFASRRCLMVSEEEIMTMSGNWRIPDAVAKGQRVPAYAHPGTAV